MFANRREAGRLLGERLQHLGNRPGVVVLALPRGGVPVAYEVAKAIGAPLDVFLVRKLGVPGYEELAMGAVASSGIRILNEDVVRTCGISPEALEAVTARELRELERREQLYRGSRKPPAVGGRTVVLVDDGLATGATMRVAIEALRLRNPAEIIAAVPVAPGDVCAGMRTLADEVVCLSTPEPFHAVGQQYLDFAQTTDAEVQELLAKTSS